MQGGTTRTRSGELERRSDASCRPGGCVVVFLKQGSGWEWDVVGLVALESSGSSGRERVSDVVCGEYADRGDGSLAQ
jgi:hypothetical protein